MKDFFRIRIPRKNIGELILCLPFMFIVFAFTKILGHFELTEKELFLALMVFWSLMTGLGCFLKLTLIGKQLEKHYKEPRHTA